MQAITGPPFSRDDVIRAIEQDEPFGQITLQAEKSYLHDLLDQDPEESGMMAVLPRQTLILFSAPL